MNMLVGVLVEAVQTVATCEHEQIHIDFAKRVLWDMIDKSGADEASTFCGVWNPGELCDLHTITKA